MTGEGGEVVAGSAGRAGRISVVVPLFDEAESVSPLVAAVREALDGAAPDWELLLVDDGSRDDTARIAAGEASLDPRVRLLRLARNYGQTQAIQAGFDHAGGDVVVTMDGDLQNDPRDIEALLREIDRGYDVVSGYRVDRADPLLSRRIPSRIANRLIRLLTRLPVRDIGCTLKAYRREVVERMALYADQHRFIPVLAAAAAGARITEVPVRHHPRRFGASNYGLTRVPRVLADLLIIKMIFSFHDRPLALFGIGAFGAFSVSAGFIAGSLAVALLAGGADTPGGIVFPGMALLFFALACHLVLLGLLGEVMVRLRIPRRGGAPLATEVTP